MDEITLESDDLVENVTLEVSETIVITEGTLDWYDGSYEAIPRKKEQVLETEQKSMRENVTIRPITYSAIDNLYGGQTVTIGLE